MRCSPTIRKRSLQGLDFAWLGSYVHSFIDVITNPSLTSMAKLSLKLVRVKYMSNYIPPFNVDVITYPCPDTDAVWN